MVADTTFDINKEDLNSHRLCYLDHAATSPLKPSVKALAIDLLEESLGNPTGAHSLAQRAKKYLEAARESISDVLNVGANQIIFCSSATEANNIAILGSISETKGKKILVSAIEHNSVLVTARQAAKSYGMDLGLIPVDQDGLIDLNWLSDNLNPDVALVSVMLVNNEIGTIQNIEQIGGLVREKAPEALFHSDAAQGTCWVKLSSLQKECHLVSLSAHKAGGPVGVGALYMSSDARIKPVIFGGSQERSLRAGTQNVIGACLMAQAVKDAQDNLEPNLIRIKPLRDKLIDELVKSDAGIRETTSRESKIAGNAHVIIESVGADELLWALDDRGVCASTGSSCASGAITKSHVLSAIGIKSSDYLSGLRLTLGWSTTEEEVAYGANAIVEALHSLRVSHI